MKKIGFYIRIEVGEICNSLILKRKNAIVKKILENLLISSKAD